MNKILILITLLLTGCGSVNVHEVELARELRLSAEAYYTAQLGAVLAANARPTFETDNVNIVSNGQGPSRMAFWQPQAPLPVRQYEGDKSAVSQVVEAFDNTLGGIGGGLVGGFIGANFVNNNSNSGGGGGGPTTKAPAGFAVP